MSANGTNANGGGAGGWFWPSVAIGALGAAFLGGLTLHAKWFDESKKDAAFAATVAVGALIVPPSIVLLSGRA